MVKTRLLQSFLLCALFILVSSITFAQSKAVSGKVLDETGGPIPGATVQVKGTSVGISTDASGNFTINVPQGGTTLIVSFVGYVKKEVAIGNNASLTIQLQLENTQLQDVVVVGYGTARKKDLTGAVASIRAKDFNKGIVTAPDQLIQGKVAGLMVINNSGAPGAATTVRIRGNSSLRTGNQPLYVVDGVPLDGRTAKPAFTSAVGTTPDANPLNFINSNDVASMEVLKDASATAIYGSRGSNGVILITTKQGEPGKSKLDVNYSTGFSNVLKKLDVLSADEYRSALKQYNINNGDFGGNVNAMDAITQTGNTQNINLALSGGNETSKYRASFGLLDQEGIIKKTGLKKYTANLNGRYTFLEDQRLGVDYNVQFSHTTEILAPISNDAGFRGSLITQALQWNPTRPLYKPDGSLNILAEGQAVNPVAMSKANDDKVNISGILASIAPYFKITKDLEYRFAFSINHFMGERESQISSIINLPGVEGKGAAFYGTAVLNSQLFTHTLSYNKKLNNSWNLGAVIGYEYQKFDYKGRTMGANTFTTNAISYVDAFQDAPQVNTNISSFRNPTSELQSVFGRVNLNYRDKYFVTTTVRADGSSKFGKENRYGYFPSFSAKWVASGEDFLKGNGVLDYLAFRAGWGITGNQEFPPGASQEQYGTTNAGSAGLQNVANTKLKWEETKQLNVGMDFNFVGNRVTGNIDYFHRNTTNILFNLPTILPAPSSTYWINIPANIINKGVEISLRSDIVKHNKFTWNLGVNATFLRNEFTNYDGAPLLTGAINGQGLTGASAQRIANGYPLNTFYVRNFEGLDKDGLSIFTDDGKFFMKSNPNPKTLIGINTELTYDKFSLIMSAHGAFGYEIYNNTANAVLPINNLGNMNVDKKLIGNGENPSNAITTSSRYLESGNFLKMDNVTLTYTIGKLGKYLNNVNVFVTGQNLFIITKYSGFDPEVNTDKNMNGVTSLGIEYGPYPTARTVQLGVNFRL
ncbi:iron complex outermembrane receptor protein [Chitinophaga skermanii]|uniref:Iron complex outermembrane receptor protein n=1 Tax=Chitinophaga skermanii TaxID=331697 RepID=A0A327QAC2_9BACT|nr:SusC/RagA family TonB-linked outer membrane protein [Chitinophaga skermanii]RAJ01586.1 iron complex outermembrane receptor protein [Chitinophaga skermanii]